MAKITSQQLKRNGCCDYYLCRFKEYFGDEVEVTEETALKYYNDFDWNWASHYLLPEEKVRIWIKYNIRCYYDKSNAKLFVYLYNKTTPFTWLNHVYYFLIKLFKF